jgi:hypothetical protein
MRKALILSALLMLAAGALAAQDRLACADEKSHEFDFWIGEWQVWSGDDIAGTNSIQPILDGCVLQESWLGARGSAGSSFNFYNPQTGKWQQFWVWRRGTTLELSGGFAEGKMTLEGDSVGRDGETVRNRITWYDNEDKTVRQHWQVSKDNGKTWETAFDGLYRRKK